MGGRYRIRVRHSSRDHQGGVRRAGHGERRGSSVRARRVRSDVDRTHASPSTSSPVGARSKRGDGPRAVSLAPGSAAVHARRRAGPGGVRHGAGLFVSSFPRLRVEGRSVFRGPGRERRRVTRSGSGEGASCVGIVAVDRAHLGDRRRVGGATDRFFPVARVTRPRTDCARGPGRRGFAGRGGLVRRRRRAGDASVADTLCERVRKCDDVSYGTPPAGSG